MQGAANDQRVSQIHCQYCRRPLAGKTEPTNSVAYCSIGCALRGKVPVDAEGNFPVNGNLWAAVGIGFVFFNQLLLWGTVVWLNHQGKTGLVTRFKWLSVGLAFLVWFAVVVWQRVERVNRGKDFVFAVLTFSLLLKAAFGSPGLSLLAAANGVFLFWNFRGVFFPAASPVRTEG